MFQQIEAIFNNTINIINNKNLMLDRTCENTTTNYTERKD